MLVVSNSSFRVRGDRKAYCQVFNFIRHDNMDMIGPWSWKWLVCWITLGSQVFQAFGTAEFDAVPGNTFQKPSRFAGCAMHQRERPASLWLFTDAQEKVQWTTHFQPVGSELDTVVADRLHVFNSGKAHVSLNMNLHGISAALDVDECFAPLLQTQTQTLMHMGSVSNSRSWQRKS